MALNLRYNVGDVVNLRGLLLLCFLDSVHAFILSQLPLSPSNESQFLSLGTWWGCESLHPTVKDFEKSREEEISFKKPR